jgi:glyoxylase-like metal-dependent hydrolase (beta-lactamase superfamily II)
MRGRVLETGLSWMIGDIEVTSIVEQDLWWKIGRFLPGATQELVASVPWIGPYLDDDPEFMSLRVQAFVIDTGTQKIVVDTCVGNDKDRDFWSFDKLSTDFLEQMTGAGHPPESIDVVLCTHLHVDHVGWNTRRVANLWVPTFPNARYLFGREEYEYWSHETDDLTLSLLEDSIGPVVAAGLVDLVEFDHVVGPGIALIATTGHTPGHVSVSLESAGRRAVIIGDMTHHPIQLAHPEVCSTADIDPELATATRRARFASWCSDDVLVIGTHFAPPTAGHLAVDGDGWRLHSPPT